MMWEAIMSERTFNILNIYAMVFSVAGTVEIVCFHKSTQGILCLVIGAAIMIAAYVGRNTIARIDKRVECQLAHDVEDCEDCDEYVDCDNVKWGPQDEE